MASAGLEEDSRLQLLFVGVVGCVAKGTEVLMTEGDEKKVEDLRVGDKILSWDVERGHLVEGTIVSFKTDKSHDAVELNRELIVSPRQLVYTQSGWRSASELDERDAIGMLNDRNELTFVAITTISKVNRSGPVYDLKIVPVQTYFGNRVLLYDTKPTEKEKLTVREWLGLITPSGSARQYDE